MSRRQNRVSPLTIVLPAPSLPRKRSSMLSTSSIGSAPRTPRSACASPACATWILNPSNRKSSDSWNSSNNDFGDEGEAAEWKSDHILLLSRTLDALPSHLVTPFHGPIPPSNLLDKIARGIAQAKGPVEWPFSLRATRVKLIEIARARSKDDSPNENDGPVPTPAKRRALYRQSSMDFIHESASEDHHGVESINRLSTRLQRTTDCVVDAHQSFHPYSRTRASTRIAQRRSSSPPRPSHLLSLINPATPSTSTLTTLSSVSSRSHHRRSGGTLTSMTSNDSMSSLGLADAKIPYPLLPSTMTSAPDPRVQRVRRSESFCGPMSSRDSLPFLPPTSPISTRHTLKRAPSYGAMAQESKEVNRARAANDGLPVRGNSPCPSSDEEEKLRTKYAKKARTKTANGISNAAPLLASPDVKTKAVKKCKESIQTRPKDQTPPAPTSKSPARQRMNLQRNPSIFGDELPCLHIAGPALSPADEPPSSSPQTPKKAHTLRRVKRLGLAPSRKLSFGAGGPALDGGNDADAEDEFDRPLASGFQLR